MLTPQQQFCNLCEYVRSSPGMYLGSTGPAAIPRLTDALINVAFATATVIGQPSILLSIAKQRDLQTISILFTGLRPILFAPHDATRWFDGVFGNDSWEITAVAGISDRFKLEVWAEESGAVFEVHHTESFKASTKASKGRPVPGIRITFTPGSAFQGLNHDDLYRVAGTLRDASSLRPGTAAFLRAEGLKQEVRYYYQQGLKSLLFEEDYARWALHAGCLSFAASSNEMNVEGHLRFLHAGVPCVRNYVNFRPSQGGAHLEGLGDALKKLFPDAKRGCREAPLITNPDTGARVNVPHNFIGALHLRIANPKYRGPTKDVLIGEDVRKFVREAATKPLKRQWEQLRAQRSA